jgi:hypothetical protein
MVYGSRITGRISTATGAMAGASSSSSKKEEIHINVTIQMKHNGTSKQSLMAPLLSIIATTGSSCNRDHGAKEEGKGVTRRQVTTT